MNKSNFSTILLLAAMTLLASASARSASGYEQAATTVDAAEAEKWRADLRHMAEEMPRTHKNLFHMMTREQCEAAVKKLHDRIPQLARHQIIVGVTVCLRPFRSITKNTEYSPVQAQPDFSSLEHSISEEMKAQNAPGAQVAVISGDRVIFQKGFGVASVETNEPVTTETLFRLGSTTKTFVATAAVALAEQGKLDLNKPIGGYAKGLQPPIARLTMHQLLSHTAGLKDEAPMTGPLDETALAERVRGWNESMFFAEGKVFSYSNPGYVLAGYVIEQVGGKPFADVLNELDFQPLAMKRSTFRPTMAMTWPLAQGHNPTRQGAQVIRPFAEHAGNWPPGSLFSNVTEISRFLIALLNQGKLEDKQIFSSALAQTISLPKAVWTKNRFRSYELSSL